MHTDILLVTNTNQTEKLTGSQTNRTTAFLYTPNQTLAFLEQNNKACKLETSCGFLTKMSEKYLYDCRAVNQNSEPLPPLRSTSEELDETDLLIVVTDAANITACGLGGEFFSNIFHSLRILRIPSNL